MSKHRANNVKRRRIIVGAAATGGLAAASAAGYWLTRSDDEPATPPTAEESASPTAEPSASPSPEPDGERGAANSTKDGALPGKGGHPGLLHTQDDFDRMAEKVSAGESPWIEGWNRLTANGRSHADWGARPTAVVIRGGDGSNVGVLFTDVHAAYQNALRWRISGDEAHRDKAVEILNAWSATLTEINGNADRFLAAGIYGYQAANAAELVRDVDGFELGRFQDMLADVFYPLNDHFLTNHNDACVTNYWSNWDLCNLASVMAIGVFNEDQSLFDRAVDYMYNGEGNGSLDNAIPFVHDGGLAQQQESGRDQAHSLMATGLLGAICEMAWNQGVDLYGYDDGKVAKCAEYVARYNLGRDVPFTTYQWGHGQTCAPREQTVISETQRGQVRPVWESIYHHYAGRQGREMPNVADMIAQNGPEGGGGDYGGGSGGYDALGFGTLAFAR
ncbi:alginate lyase family protein [Glycomyces sp. YM15]|uniref:alginate lyase family protein n=1 Tax=Glycomyces sp. YM15 TaxID=2800446 RepID=UPI001962576F|nr:alginate lyase family protein [Glycomyces sp. YM15]